MSCSFHCRFLHSRTRHALDDVPQFLWQILVREPQVIIGFPLSLLMFWAICTPKSRCRFSCLIFSTTACCITVSQHDNISWYNKNFSSYIPEGLTFSNLQWCVLRWHNLEPDDAEIVDTGIWMQYSQPQIQLNVVLFVQRHRFGRDWHSYLLKEKCKFWNTMSLFMWCNNCLWSAIF